MIATGITATGHREVLGVDIGDSEDETFWTKFCRGLRERGLGGVRLVISDAHEGLNKVKVLSQPLERVHVVGVDQRVLLLNVCDARCRRALLCIRRIWRQLLIG